MKFLSTMLTLLVFVSACSKDRRDDARTEFDKIHAEIRGGDFVTIYQEASPRIHQCYSEQSFSEKLKSLINKLKAIDPTLNYRELESETAKFDAIASNSDLFIEGVYSVGSDTDGIREDLVLKKEGDKLRLFSYRVIDASNESNVGATMIACAANE